MSGSFTGNPGGQVPENYVIPDDSALAHLKIRQYLNDIAYSLNRKDSGYFISQSTITGQQFVPTFSTDSGSSTVYRSVLRKVIDTGTLANTGTTTTAHGITIGSNFSVTKLYGAATNPSAPSWIPIPFAHPTAANNISVDVDGTNVNITTGSNRSAYTRSWVVIEYITST